MLDILAQKIMKANLFIAKEFNFDSAHRLRNYNGPCSNLHGHTYKLQVILKGEIKKNGMVMDFTEIKDLVYKRVIQRLDHNFINKLIKQPTAENIAIWIWKQLEKKLPLYEIKLWETPSSYVIFRGSEDK